MSLLFNMLCSFVRAFLSRRKCLLISWLKSPSAVRSMKRQKYITLKDKLPRSVGAQYATGKDGETTPERMKRWSQSENKAQLWMWLVMEVRCCKDQDCIGTWNVRSMTQGKLEAVKWEMAGANIDILGISELKWTGMGEFNLDDNWIYYCRQESLRKKGAVPIIKKRVKDAVFVCNLKNDRMISVHFQANHSVSQ